MAFAAIRKVLLSSIGVAYTAAAPDSPVRMRIISFNSVTKILPSPTWPVFAAVMMVAKAFSAYRRPRRLRS